MGEIEPSVGYYRQALVKILEKYHFRCSSDWDDEEILDAVDAGLLRLHGELRESNDRNGALREHVGCDFQHEDDLRKENDGLREEIGDRWFETQYLRDSITRLLKGAGCEPSAGVPDVDLVWLLETKFRILAPKDPTTEKDSTPHTRVVFSPLMASLIERLDQAEKRLFVLETLKV